MGACATKPKVLKEEGAQAPVPEPEPAAVEATTVEDLITKSRGVDEQIITPVVPVVVEEKEKKIVVDDEIADGEGVIKVDDDQSAKRSLSNLFKENEIEKAADAIEKAPAEVVKQESSETEKPEELTVKERSLDLSNPAEPEKHDKVETEKSVSEVPVEMEKPEKHDQVETEKAVPVETEKPVVIEKQEEPLVTEKKPEEPVKPEEPIVIEKTVEIIDTKLPTAEISENPVEPTVSLPAVDAPAEVETEKVIEATPAVETKTGNETSAEKKPEESKTSNETSSEKKPEESKDSTVTA